MSYQPSLDHPVFFNGTALNTQNWTTSSGVLIQNVDGWMDAVDVRDTRDAATARDGEVPYNLFLGGRTITISGLVSGTTFANLQANKQALVAKLLPSTTEYVLKMPKAATSSPTWTFAASMSGFERSTCRVVESVVFGEQRGPQAQSFVVVLRASDPRIYDDVETTATDTSTATSQSVAISNTAGTYPSPCTVQFTNSSSSITGAQIVNDATGSALTVKSSVTVGTNDSYLFDTGQRYLTATNTDQAAFRLNNFSPTLYYKLDETGAATTAANYANPGTYSGTIVGSPTLGTAGPIGTRMDFDGVNDEVTVPYNAALVLDTFTIECFAAPSSSTQKPILEWSNGGSTGWYVTAGTNGAVQNRFDLYINGTYQTSAISYSVGGGTNTYNYVAVTKTGNTWYLITRFGANLTKSVVGKAVTNITTGTIRLGRRGSSYFAGWMDNVVLYPSVLDDSTLLALSNPSASLPSYPGAKYLDFANNSWWQVQPGTNNVSISKSASTASTLTVKYRPARL